MRKCIKSLKDFDYKIFAGIDKNDYYYYYYYSF